MKTSKIIPVVMLVVLLIVWFTRWDYKATKTFSDGIAKWKIDRWTCYRWREVYKVDASWEDPAYNDRKLIDDAEKYRKITTCIWYSLFAVNCVWLIIVWLLSKKYEQNNKTTKKVNEEEQT